MRTRSPFLLAIPLFLALIWVQSGPAQQGKATPKAKAAAKSPAIPAGDWPRAADLPRAADWPMYSRDLTSTRFSPLTQITTANVANLKQAWTWRPPAPPPAADGKAQGKGKAKGGGGGGGGVNPQATPIVVNGVMYVPAGNRLAALDGDTGRLLWMYEGQDAITSRSIAYWPGDGNNPPRVLFNKDTTMVALNANTGAVDPGFGKEGSVDIEITWSGAPYIYKNLILIGNNNGERTDGPNGDLKVYDARTGAELWRFKTIAQPGDPNHNTWLKDDSWQNRGGVNPWGWYLTVDEERDLIYLRLGSPAGNYYGGDRPGNNLYANSLVAINATTGKYVWHFQVVHHDLWDTDLPAAPSLFNVQKDGRTIPALAVIGKNALMFILNRETGEPIHGVEERSVPKGDVPGEWYSPTQPFPLKPAPLARMSFNKAEDFIRASDTTPEHVAACEELWERAGGFWNYGPYTPFPFHEEGAPPKTGLQFPGNGGPNWGGTAADPRTGYVYVATHDAALTGWLEKKKPGGNYGALTEGSPLPIDRGSINGPGPYNGFSAGGFPCQRPPWGRLFAVNANTGDIAWEVVLGINERLPEGKQKVGNVGSAGPTVTAGGVLFVPSADAYFHAFDSRTGRELWSVKMDGAMNANPMSYAGKSGKQYVAGVAGGAVVVWAAP